MLCYVYPLCIKGVRQPAAEVLRAAPVYGWLVYNRPHPMGMPGEHALFLDPEERQASRLPDLWHARLRRIEGGMLLIGSEQWIGKHPSSTRQGWAAATSAEDARALVQSLKRKREVVEAVWAARQER